MVKRVSYDNDMLDVSLSDVRNNSMGITSLARNNSIGLNNDAEDHGASAGMISFDLSTTSMMQNTNHKVNESKASCLSYGKTSGDSNGLLIHEDVFDDSDLEGLDNTNQSHTTGSFNALSDVMSWFSRRTPNSGDISHAVSSIDS